MIFFIIFFFLAVLLLWYKPQDLPAALERRIKTTSNVVWQITLEKLLLFQNQFSATVFPVTSPCILGLASFSHEQERELIAFRQDGGCDRVCAGVVLRVALLLSYKAV